MKKLKLLSLLALIFINFSVDAQVKNYTIEAITRLQTNGSFIYQGSTINFNSGILDYANLPANLEDAINKRHDAVTITGENYAALAGQQITFSNIDLVNNVTGILGKVNGGTGIDGTGLTFYHSGNANLSTVDWSANSGNFYGGLNLRAAGTYSAELRLFNDTDYVGIRSKATQLQFIDRVNQTERLNIDMQGNFIQYKDISGNFKTVYHSGNANLSTVDWNAKNIIASGSGGFVTGLVVGDNTRTSDALFQLSNNDVDLEFSIDNAITNTARILAYDRATNTHRDLQLRGASVSLLSGGTERLVAHSAGTATTGDGTISGYLGSPTYVSGFSGSGWRTDPSDNSQSHLTIDRLTVRDRMDVYELVINQIRATNGSLWVSDAVKVETVAGTTLNVNDDTDITFLVNDVIKAQQFDGRNVRTYTATVTTVGATSFTVSNVVGTGWDGMELVRIGNTTNTDRQGALYLTSSDSNAPYMDVIDGNTDTSFSGDTKGRFGRLDGITSSTFGALTGYGFWTENGYLEGSINATGGEIASWTIDTDRIHKDYTTFSISAGTVSETSIRGFHVSNGGSGSGLNRVSVGTTESGAFWGIWGTLNGIDVFRLGETNEIAGWSFTDTELTSGNIEINSSGYIRHVADDWRLNSDGSGQLAQGSISWTAGGVLDVDRITATSGTIGAFSIDGTYIWTGTQQTTNAYTTAGMTIGNGAIRAQKFRVDTDGTLHATDGNFSGAITGSTITGGIVQTGTIGQRVVIESTGNTLSFYDQVNTQRILIDDNLLANRPAIKITEGAFYATDGISLSYMDEDQVVTPRIEATTVSATTTTTSNLAVSGIKQITGTFSSNTDTSQFVDLSSQFSTMCVGGIVGGNSNTGVLPFIVRGSSGSGNIGLWVNRDDGYSGIFTVRYVAWGF